jgi:hypothetical protein
MMAKLWQGKKAKYKASQKFDESHCMPHKCTFVYAGVEVIQRKSRKRYSKT